jgi:DNA-binding Xre family transcriptional regulator
MLKMFVVSHYDDAHDLLFLTVHTIEHNQNMYTINLPILPTMCRQSCIPEDILYIHKNLI